MAVPYAQKHFTNFKQKNFPTNPALVMARNKERPSLVVHQPIDKSFTPPTSSPIDAIVVSRFEQVDSNLEDEEIHETAATETKRAVTDATIDRSNDPIRWGNSKGLSVLERLDQMDEQQKRITFLLAETKHLKGVTETLTNEVEALKMTTESYLSVRSRFFAVFLRDKLLKVTHADKKIIADGNMAAHCGDPLVDAVMFKKKIRSDDKTYYLLYGMQWQRVLEYGNFSLQLWYSAWC